jgi:ubiquinone/menaquinone biosynthesis C-methylase UbiE
MGTLTRTLIVALAACGGPSAQPASLSQPAPGATSEDAHEMHGDHAQHQHHGHAQHRFEKADEWAPVFDDPARDAWQKPDEVVAALALSPGMIVADIGAGTGYFEKRLATAVTPTGKVIAIDVEPDMARYIETRAKREGTPNVEAKVGKADDPTLAPASVDRILIVDTWHHIADRNAYAKKLAAALEPGGFVLVVDFTLETAKGPPKQHRLAPDAVTAELQQAGLEASIVNESLPDQYIIKAER